MKVLIIGGSNFIGPQLIIELVQKGHDVSIFNRGNKKEATIPEGVERLVGNRDGNLLALENRDWDVVIDSCGYIPRIVEQSCRVLEKHTKQYIFISTVSVYDNFEADGIDENYPLGHLEIETEEINDVSYGPLKVLCEKLVLRYFPTNSLIIRPGLIVGATDPTKRFSFWPLRFAQGGDIIVPGNPDQPIQVIDVVDLCAWLVKMMERNATGIYNATGPSKRMTLKHLVEECQKQSEKQCNVHWVDEEFLLNEGVKEWVDYPLWFASNKKKQGLLAVDIRKAENAGLTFRPLSDTIKDILKTDLAAEIVGKTIGIPADKEALVLNKWVEAQSPA